MCSIYVYTFSVNDDLNHDKVVCPPSLKIGAFSTAAIDNIDHYSSSNTISLFQHPSLGKGDERKMSDFQIKQKEIKKTATLCTDIKPATLNKTITTQGHNALKETPNSIPNTKTSSNDRQEEEGLNM